MRATEPYTIFQRTLPSGKKVYYFQFRMDDGSRSVARSTGETVLARAKRYCKRLYDEGFFSQTSSLKFRDFAGGFFDEGSRYRKWKRACGSDLRFETVRAYNRLLKYQLLPYLGDYEVSKINVDVVKSWIVWLTERWSPKTSNSAQSVLNIILKSAFERNLIRKVPSYGVPLRKVGRRKRQLLTVDELRNIYSLEWDSELRKRAFLLCALTGMRIGEVCGLPTKNVYGSYVYVEHTLVWRHGLGETKTGVNRYVPIPEKLGLKGKCGEKYAFDDGCEPLAIHRVYNSFIGKCRELGIDTKSRGITIHSLRNFFISHLRGCGISDTKIKAVVGHADESMTDHYTYWTLEMFADILEVQRKLYEDITGGDE